MQAKVEPISNQRLLFQLQTKAKSRSNSPTCHFNKSQRLRGMWWTAAAFIAFNHALCLYVLFFTHQWTRVNTTVLQLTVLFAWLHLLGITAGYHRLWSHNAYKAKLPLRVFLSIIGLMAFQGSIRWWALRHRLHHRFTDTPFDPHDSRRGLVYSHVGWLFTRPPAFTKLQYVNTRDLDSDVVVRMQQRWLLIGYVLFGVLLQACIGWLCFNDVWLGVVWLGFFARLFSWHCIWSINSLSHWRGVREYDYKHSSAVHIAWIGVFQNGEGHHNYHHAFPFDYRHGIRATDWDPTKWCIAVWALLGLASDLRVMQQNQIKQAVATSLIQRAEEAKAKAIWPVPDCDLPELTLSEFKQTQAEQCLPWLICNGYIVDVGHFQDHPGGAELLRAHYGQDVTRVFEGGVNRHTQAAHRLMLQLAVGKIKVEKC